MKDNPSFEYVNEKTAAVDVKIGTLDSLETKSKTDIVSAVNELFTNVSDGKALVASAITDKGVSTQSDATFATMAANIRDIPTGTTPTGTKQITITENGTTTENVAAYENAEITVHVSGGGSQANYRAGSFSLSDSIPGTAAKVVDLDADALSHKADKTLMLAIHRLGDVSEGGSLGYIGTNGAKNGGRYGFGFYQASETANYSSQVMTAPPSTVQTAGQARAYVGDDGIYLIANAGYKWKPGTYGYLVLW